MRNICQICEGRGELPEGRPRKNLLVNLTGVELPAGNSMVASPVQRFGENFPASGTARGAIGAVSRSIEQIRSQAIMELAPNLIVASFIEDRLA